MVTEPCVDITEWQTGTIELDPADWRSNGKVCIIWSPPGHRPLRIGFDPVYFPPGSPLREGQPLEWRLTTEKPEFRFPEGTEVTAAQQAADRWRAADIATAGGATLITDDDLVEGP